MRRLNRALTSCTLMLSVLLMLAEPGFILKAMAETKEKARQRSEDQLVDIVEEYRADSK